jgi:oligoendopeptidase F
MELLASPYLTKDRGGFYTPAEAARATIELLEGFIIFWPYMAVVDLFQHWVHENLGDSRNPENCDAKWSELWDTYMVGVDWDGFDETKATGWHRKLHIFQEPFYYIDYGLAQIGAIQIWENSLSDQHGAVKKYLEGLALGATRTLPELFKATGGQLAFDRETVSNATNLLLNKIEELEKVE